MTALWIAGYALMVVALLVTLWLMVQPEDERAKDIRCGLDCIVLLALGCFAEGLVFGASGVGVL